MPDVRTRITGEVLQYFGDQLPCPLSVECRARLPEVLEETLWKGFRRIDLDADNKHSDAKLAREWNNWAKTYLEKTINDLAKKRLTEVCGGEPGSTIDFEELQEALGLTVAHMRKVVDRARSGQGPVSSEIKKMLESLPDGVDYPFCEE